MSNIAKNLKEYRLKNRLNQAEMAEKLGLKSAKSYRYYETLENWVSMQKAKIFSEKLGVDLFNSENFMTEEPEKKMKAMQAIYNLTESNKLLSDANKRLAENVNEISGLLKDWMNT